MYTSVTIFNLFSPIGDENCILLIFCGVSFEYIFNLFSPIGDENLQVYNFIDFFDKSIFNLFSPIGDSIRCFVILKTGHITQRA